MNYRNHVLKGLSDLIDTHARYVLHLGSRSGRANTNATRLDIAAVRAAIDKRLAFLDTAVPDADDRWIASDHTLPAEHHPTPKADS